jgi:ATP-dependent DNA ligase
MRLRRRRVLPEVTPVVPVIHPQAFDDPAHLFEPKYDGFRGLVYVSGREAFFRSKRSLPLRRFTELAYWVREQLGGMT